MSILVLQSPSWGRGELVALIGLSSWCLMIVMWLFLAVPWVCLRFVSGVVFPDHAHLLIILDVLPPTRGALDLHITRANNQAKIWLQADYVIMDIENKPTETINLWQEGTNGLEFVWKCFLAIPVVCMQPLSCLCKVRKKARITKQEPRGQPFPFKTKCTSMRRKCYKASLKCTPACRFAVICFPSLTHST